MRQYQITIDGRTFHVRLLSDPHRDRVEIEVDGRPLVVDVLDLDADEARPEPSGSVPAPGAPRVAAAEGAAAVPASAPSGRAVVAPLPGVVKSVAVRPGQRIGPGDELLVIEAMKMDNIIRAVRQGVVDAVHVAEGHRVAHGQPMVEYRE